MCGRFVSTSSPERISSYFGASFDTDPIEANYEANYNVAPTTDVLGVVAGQGGAPVVRSYHWGLVPSWAKDVKVGSRMINARAETLAEKPAFRRSFLKHRIIVPMDGFYEWQVVPGQTTKQPIYIHRVDDEPLAVAGLWAAWRDPAIGDDAPWLHSCTVITTSANDVIMPIHDRMPVVLPQSRWAEWLDTSNCDLEGLSSLFVAAPDELLVLTPVSTEVNNVRNRGPALIEALAS